MTKHVLISIKPRYAKKIWCGEKRYEFRRAIPQEHVPLATRFYVYESAPVKRIVGYFVVDAMLGGDGLMSLWDVTKDYAGIGLHEYVRYFSGAQWKCAMHIPFAQKFLFPRELWEIGLKRAPQNYLYLTPEQSQKLESFGFSLIPRKNGFL